MADCSAIFRRFSAPEAIRPCVLALMAETVLGRPLEESDLRHELRLA